MHIVVLGAGSLGSLIGGLLAPSERVTLVGRAPHMRRVASAGLRMTGTRTAHVHPETATDYAAVSNPDLVLVTVKSYDTDTAVDQLATNPPRTVVSLQNGLGNEETLAAGLPDDVTVLAGTTTYAALLDEPGHVECTGEGEVVVGHPDGGPSAAAQRLTTVFESAGMDALAATDMPTRLWRKLAINAGINPTAALTGTQNREILEAPLRGIATAAARETARVAEDHGIAYSPGEAGDELLAVAEATADNTCSMARDLELERRTEVDAINGAVIDRAGDRPIPVNTTLYGLMVGREQALGLREVENREDQLEDGP